MSSTLIGCNRLTVADRLVWMGVNSTSAKKGGLSRYVHDGQRQVTKHLADRDERASREPWELTSHARCMPEVATKIGSLVPTMANLPKLPVRLPVQTPYTPNIRRAFQIISAVYSQAQRIWAQEDGDPIRLRALAQTLETNIYPLLLELARESQEYDWAGSAAECLGSTIHSLRSAADSRQDRCKICCFS